MDRHQESIASPGIKTSIFVDVIIATLPNSIANAPLVISMLDKIPCASPSTISCSRSSRLDKRKSLHRPNKRVKPNAQYYAVEFHA
mmetsp:Transcript_1859/g.4004  ORF Transcript_1859/g.4004 Transcript_1859/m.4004 type:complete len:86 (+) Transcript_1859:126-383(+)